MRKRNKSPGSLNLPEREIEEAHKAPKKKGPLKGEHPKPKDLFRANAQKA